jgi:RNA polymerase sigma-70 factor, ECF subfamily
MLPVGALFAANLSAPDRSVSALPRDLDATYREHADFVYRVACQLGVDATHVEDVVHDVFLVVHRRMAEYDGRSMRSWLYGITRRVVLHHHRGRRRAQTRTQLAPVPASAPDPEERTAAHEAVAIVESFVASLDEDQRTVFVLVELEGTPMPEIARALGVNLNTLYSRLRLARRRFEQHLALHRGQPHHGVEHGRAEPDRT